MSEEKVEATETEVKKPGIIKVLLVPLVVGIVCAGLGFSVPMLFPSILGGEHHEEEPPPAPPEVTFIPFGEVVVNLNEARMNRYLRVNVTLQMLLPVEHLEEEKAKMTALVEGKKSILTSWLLSHLADMNMEDIRGAAGQNRLRREVHDYFNQVLFPDGEGQIDEVLFELFNVQ